MKPIHLLPIASFSFMIWAMMACCATDKPVDDFNDLEWPEATALTKPPLQPEPTPEVQEPPVIQDPELVIVGYRYEIVKVSTELLYATCYSQEDGPIEAKGIYANQKFAAKLSRSERRIQRTHYTCAMPPELKRYHEALIELPNGKWTHKFRVHIPDYNTAEFPAMKSRDAWLPEDQKLLKLFDDDYFSVPRDRMKWTGRIDVLFTTAGKYATIKQRQNQWAKKNTHNWPCDIWEIVEVPVYGDAR